MRSDVPCRVLTTEAISRLLFWYREFDDPLMMYLSVSEDKQAYLALAIRGKPAWINFSQNADDELNQCSSSFLLWHAFRFLLFFLSLRYGSSQMIDDLWTSRSRRRERGREQNKRYIFYSLVNSSDRVETIIVICRRLSSTWSHANLVRIDWFHSSESVQI